MLFRMQLLVSTGHKTHTVISGEYARKQRQLGNFPNADALYWAAYCAAMAASSSDMVSCSFPPIGGLDWWFGGSGGALH